MWPRAVDHVFTQWLTSAPANPPVPIRSFHQEDTVLGLIISLIIIGLIAGALARLIIPGKQHISILMTIVLGIVGSFVGGFLGFLIFQHDPMDGFFQPAGIIGSVIGAVIVLFIYTRFAGRSASRR
ncbi:putative membrane protein YeaQ/YmgE (transglycosylase-associated protein family) [Curtobacterium sp. PhB136]|nr:putative membrane protein YeaQ/YmgE (transglycosylase-associated protein family) [Curtobacterium sp. PhB136]